MGPQASDRSRNITPQQNIDKSQSQEKLELEWEQNSANLRRTWSCRSGLC